MALRGVGWWFSATLIACTVACTPARPDMTPDQSPQVDSLLDELEKTEPAFHGLGTPEPAETDAMRRLVAMGAPIVPHLIERTRAAGSAKTMAYLALILGRIGDARAAAPLRELRARYQAREPKGEWDYAVIGQCNVALGRLEGPGR